MLGGREQVDRSVTGVDPLEVRLGLAQSLLALTSLAEHGVCLGGVQHAQPGQDLAGVFRGVGDPSDGWRGRTAQAGGGCIIDMGYHLIDMLLWYFGLPDRVLADMSMNARPDRSYDAEDTALIHFSYDSGLYGSLLLSRFIGPKAEQIRLVGSKGIVHLERGRIQRLSNSGDVIESLAREQSWPSAAISQVNYFCRVIEGLRPNVSGPRENLAHLSFISGCYQSARERSYVDPKELL